jgi:cytochrome c-type biogenesis protein CcmH/NrfF
MQYLAIPQAVILLDVWMGAHGWGAWFWPCLLLVVASLVLFGYAERRAGLAEAEMEYQWSLSPQARALVNGLKDGINDA